MKRAIASVLKNGKRPIKRTPRRKIKLRSDRFAPWESVETQFNVETRSSKWWDLFKDGINNSGLALWLSDRHQFYLRYVCGYDVPAYADAIEFGNVFHWLIEEWHKHPKRLLKKPLNALFEDYHPAWMGTQQALTPANKSTQTMFYHLAAVMFPFYADKYKADLGTPNKTIEREFRAEHKLKDGTKIPLYGTIDLEWGRKELTIIDHKTSSWIVVPEVEAALPLNLQLMFYAHARKLESKKSTAEIAHDVIRRTTMKKTQKETFDKFAKRVLKDVQSRPDFYFVRLPAAVGPDKQANYSKYIINPMIDDLAGWVRGSVPHYPNPNALIGRYGPCRLFGPITTANFGGIARKRPTTRGVEV